MLTSTQLRPSRPFRAYLPEIDEEERAPVVLVAEDDPRMGHLLAMTLRRDGFEVTEARDGEELLDRITDLHLHPSDGRPVDLIISDIRMPAMSGLDVLTALRLDDWAIPVILITAFGSEDTHAEARRLGAVAVFNKPFDLDDLRTAALIYAGAERR